MHDMQIRNLADNTQKSYLLQVSRFAQHFRRSPELLGPEGIRAWLVHLRDKRKLAPSSLCPAVGALRFLYLDGKTHRSSRLRNFTIMKQRQQPSR
ncbi:integrase family protein (plasmid) [Cupriavidus necator N-1]|uniref:Integrase family protein n=1 Tax=Cupriavidus necator (strain ATCC 43291 / DSM 13513 / CCUG 52238 / LMG 8453 / N-1) TaxID=1042878 RepID=F8GYI9_CUPNN|nr:phage integrase N-terminal SAM-like domain-containing protein [Cupriavidus necator]AEI82930.1 integrase family protein [Cupriavidus necator N-1]MDX6008724.1 phage integrase N-terminal SAM-like domain-containing protein [Cupriavidus necator]